MFSLINEIFYICNHFFVPQRAGHIINTVCGKINRIYIPVSVEYRFFNKHMLCFSNQHSDSIVMKRSRVCDKDAPKKNLAEAWNWI